MALFLTAILTAIFVMMGRDSAEWPWNAWFVLAVIFCSACWSFWISLFCTNARMCRQADAAASHPASLILAIIVWPIYYVIKTMGIADTTPTRKKRR